MKSAFIIEDQKLATAALKFAEELGLSVDQDNYSRGAGEAISVGTSKKYNIGGNADPSYYVRKHELLILTLDKDSLPKFIESVLDLYTPEVEEESEDEDNTEVEVDSDESKYNNDAIYLLVAKVKKDKKSPKNFWVVDNSGEYLLTSKNDFAGIIGNLADIFAEISAE